MTSMNPNDEKRVLYLQHIDIVTDARTKFRVKVQLDDANVKDWTDWSSSSWTESLNLEISYSSIVTITVTWEHKITRLFSHRDPNVIKISGEDAMELVWEYEESIKRNLTFDGHAMTITLRFAASTASKNIREAVQNVQLAMEKYRAVMSDTTQRRINTVTMFGVAISEANPFAKMAVGVVKATFDLLQEQKKHDDMLSDLADGIGRILPVIEGAMDLVSVKDERGLLNETLLKMSELIETTATFICDYVKRSPAKRAATSVVSPRDQLMIQSLRDGFNKLKENFDRAISLENLSGISAIEGELLLRRLKPIETASYSDSYKCMEGTREQVLNDILKWALTVSLREEQHATDMQNTNNFFWLYGMPGLGKTSVANSVCLRLHEKDRLGGSFFCRRDDPILREPKYVLPTLIHRLAEMWGPYGKIVANVLREDPQLTPDSANLLLTKAILGPINTLAKHPSHPLVLVIDALDECGDAQTRRSLLHGLKEITSGAEWLKVIVTSRPEPDIESFFKKLDGHVYSSRDLAMDEHAGRDVHHFAEQRLMSVAEKRHLRNWPSENQLDRIVGLSGGLYIFVETLWRFVEKERNPEKTLTQVLENTPDEGMTDLYKLYNLTITTVVGNDNDDFRAIFGAIVAVSNYRPLPDDTLAGLLELELPMVRSWVDDLGSLLLRDGATGGVRVRHLSIIDFLTSSNCPEAFRLDIDQAHARVGNSCLKVMTKELKFNICELETSSKLNCEFGDIQDRIKRRISDALQYSCLHWSDHLCFSPDRSEFGISETLMELLDCKILLYWIEVLSLVERVPAAAPALRQLASHIKNPDDHFQQLINDAIRFLIAFHALISKSASHIYISALAFTPSESILWRETRELFPNLLEMRKGRMSHWPAPNNIWQGHAGLVSSISCSPDGLRLISGSYDSTIRIWDTETGTAIGEPLNRHTDRITGVAYSLNGRYMASVSSDKTICIWDAVTGALANEPLSKHTDWVLSVSFSPNGRNVASGSRDKLIYIWDAETGTVVGGPLKGHTGEVNSIAYSHNGRYIASGSSDKTIRVWNASTRAEVGAPIMAHDEVMAIAYSPDSQYIVSGSKDATVRIWYAETGLAMGEPLKSHRDWVVCVAYSPDGRYIISGSYDGTICVWDAGNGMPIGKPLAGDTSEVSSIVFSMDSQHIISGFADGSIRIWDVTTAQPSGDSMKGHTSNVSGVAYSPPDGQYIASCSYDKTIRIWDPETGAELEQLSKDRIKFGVVSSVAYSPDGRSIAFGSGNRTLRIWDIKNGTLKDTLIVYQSSGATGVAFSPDGLHILCCSRDHTIQVWDVKAQVATKEPLKGHTGNVMSVSYSPNGRRIASGSMDKTVRIWNAETGESIGNPLSGHSNTITSVSYSPDSQCIATGSWDGTIRIWDAETGTEMKGPLIGHTDWINTVAYSPDGRFIVSGGRDKNIHIWDAETGEAIGRPLKGHTQDINSIAYSPNGRFIISGSADNTIRVWDIQNISAVSNSSRGPVSHISVASFLTNSDTTSFLLSDEKHQIEQVFDLQPDSDGWVKHNGGLLFWVPEECRNGLSCPAILTIPTSGRNRVVRLDFTRFRHGTSWTQVYNRQTT